MVTAASLVHPSPGEERLASFARMSFRGYWAAAREPRYSITFAFPLLLLYEVLSALLTRVVAPT